MNFEKTPSKGVPTITSCKVDRADRFRQPPTVQTGLSYIHM